MRPLQPNRSLHASLVMTTRERARALAQRWPEDRRRQVAAVIAIVAIFVATVIASSRMLRLVFNELDIFAYAGLFLACWIGAGGALVPIPGVRPISWLMVVQQGAALDPVVVALIAAVAMVLGQSSYFGATRAAIARHAKAVADGVDPAEVAIDMPPAQPDGVTARSRAMASRMKGRVEDRVRRHASTTALLVAMLPSPLTTVATTASASAGTAYPKWVIPTFVGYLVFTSILAGVGRALFQAILSLVP